MLNLRAVTTALAVAVGLSAAGPVEAGDLRIATGKDTGTYYEFGLDIERLVESAGVGIEVAQTGGSVDNIKRLLGYSGAESGEYYQLAIVQADVLEELRQHAADHDVLRDIVDRIKVVMPLYGEEIHVYVSNDTNATNFLDAVRLANPVWGGNPDSGTLRTVLSIFRNLEISTSEITLDKLGNDDALRAFEFAKSGMLIDIAGVPSSFARDSVTRDDQLKLLEVDLPELLSLPNSPYQEAVIPATAYPWMDRPVRTVAVTSLLVAFAYEDGTEPCEDIKELTRIISNNIDQLRASGHPKWNDVRLEAARQRTDLYDCARAGLYGE